MRRPYLFALLSCAAVLNVAVVDAHITRIEITSTESPTFEGRSFGDVGPYEKLRGRAYGEVDPEDPRNAVITDIELAPRNARGLVEYSMDIYILKPVDPGLGNHKLVIDVNNRGDKRFAQLNDSPFVNDPTTAADAGAAFFLERGYALAWNGWDISATPGDDRLTITVPVARNPDGSAITGPSYEYITVNNATTTTYELSYPAATLGKNQATLTVKRLLNDPPTTIEPSGWEYVDEKTIRLLPAGTAFAKSHIYEFTYTAKDPLVAGLGLAATRDFVSFLRHAAVDDAGVANPLAEDVQHTFTWAVSQPGRYLNDFQTLGFNEDERGRRVLDGIQNWVAGGTGVAINYRFAQTARTERNRQNHLYPEGVFPFAYPAMHDPVSGRSGGRAERCLASRTCPKVFEINSANEYWVKAGSLLHTDTAGRDLPDPDHVRFFLISGAQHGRGSSERGLCQQFQNPTDPAPAMRALFVALDQWVTAGVAPPASRVPRVSNGTAVFAEPRATTVTGVVPQSKLGFPTIPGVTYTGVVTTRRFFDFGPLLDEGIVTHVAPTFVDRPVYPSFVSKTDEDGNEVAGIRLPPVAAPVATTTGWASRREEFGLNDGCEGAGQSIPLARTEAERRQTNDPRLSLEARYGTHEGYVRAVADAGRGLMSERLLLERDVQRYIDEAENSDVLR
ncbi:MAG: alpha/beta hydrolase domain-containing protein [Acidobacteria bacterium]|nr:alpha/beta hydrolase domain-containing protein [Acidobacteriota bacterium]